MSDKYKTHEADKAYFITMIDARIANPRKRGCSTCCTKILGDAV
jgi:hypothetical protein